MQTAPPDITYSAKARNFTNLRARVGYFVPALERAIAQQPDKQKFDLHLKEEEHFEDTYVDIDKKMYAVTDVVIYVVGGIVELRRVRIVDDKDVAVRPRSKADNAAKYLFSVIVADVFEVSGNFDVNNLRRTAQSFAEIYTITAIRKTVFAEHTSQWESSEESLY